MTTTKESPIEKFLTPIAVLLGAIVIALAFAFGGGERPATTEPVGQEVNIADVKADGAPFVGSVTAPVTIAVWFDFQCGFCKRFESTTLSEVNRDYVESGKVRIVYKDFQFLGPASMETAVYSRAVWDLASSVWPDWFERVMTGESESTLTTAGLDAVSKELGLDPSRIAERIQEKRSEYEASITADRTEGQSFGISGTPGSIIGTTLVGGAQPYLSSGRAGEQPVKPLIDELLK